MPARPDALRFSAVVVAVSAFLLAGVDAVVVVAVLLLASLATALFGTRRLLAQLDLVRQDRVDRRGALVAANRGKVLGDAHDLLSVVGDLDEVAGCGEPSDPWLGVVRDARDRLDAIAQALADTRVAINELADERGRVPRFGGLGQERRARRGDPLRPYGDIHAIPRALPRRLRVAVSQVGRLLDEIRQLHTRQIERAVFLFTLAARASLVTLAPLLGALTTADVPLRETGLAGDLAWGAAAGCALATALYASTVVDAAMEDSPRAYVLRSRLLLVEVPVAVAVLLLCPAWTVAVFASGWTNWWQRQTPELAFSWPKLVGFVAAVIVVQTAGLALEDANAGPTALEIVLTLAAILVSGASYGAFLPLAAGVALGVLIGDSRRSLKAIREARDELLAAAAALREAAQQVLIAAPSVPAATHAAQTARQAATQLERAVERLDREAGVDALHELVDNALGHSYLLRRKHPRHRERAAAARERGAPVPAYFGSAMYTPDTLRDARVPVPEHATAIGDLLATAFNEANRHGVAGVNVRFVLAGDRLQIRVGNQPAGATRGTGGGGEERLSTLAQALPAGRLDHRKPRPASELLLGGEERWVVQVSCAAEVLRIVRPA